jgi:hypothetical protein
MLKFTFPDGQPIWINPDKVIAVQPSAAGANIYIDVDGHWSVQKSAEDVVARFEQAKER